MNWCTAFTIYLNSQNIPIAGVSGVGAAARIDYTAAATAGQIAFAEAAKLTYVVPDPFPGDETAQVTVSGSVSGSFIWSMPFQRPNLKRFLLQCVGVTDAGKAFTFLTPFAHTPVVVSNSTGVTVSSVTTTTVTLAAATNATGVLIIEGF